MVGGPLAMMLDDGARLAEFHQVVVGGEMSFADRQWSGARHAAIGIFAEHRIVLVFERIRAGSFPNGEA